MKTISWKVGSPGTLGSGRLRTPKCPEAGTASRRRFPFGVVSPALACVLGLEQIHITGRWRRITGTCHNIFLTEARTFMGRSALQFFKQLKLYSGAFSPQREQQATRCKIGVDPNRWHRTPGTAVGSRAPRRVRLG